MRLPAGTSCGVSQRLYEVSCRCRSIGKELIEVQSVSEDIVKGVKYRGRPDVFGSPFCVSNISDMNLI